MCNSNKHHIFHLTLLDYRSALEPSFSAEFIKSSQHNKDKEEEKWFNIMSLLHKLNVDTIYRGY
uniref:Uncharacterized protein n=1 Tax=Solanum tuberosum TaxID=4113 RepID=M1BEB8_SOLTU